MAFQSELSVYFDGQDDGVERFPIRRTGDDARPRLQLVAPRKTIQLRDYQEAATTNCLRDLETHRSSLVVLATGLGKTILFCKLIEQWPGRVLVLAHLEELLQNAREDLMSITGEPVGIERAKDHHEGERIVCGLIQSVSKRLKHFSKDHFSLIIVDEAHHAASKDYGRVFDHFGIAKVVGLTATDSRADGARLPFDTCSYRMGIRDGIDEGYLVPVRGKRVIIEAINLARVKRTNNEQGDFDDLALDDEMVKGASAIADVLVSDYPFEKGILFFPGCASAKLTCEFLNEREPDSAIYIDGMITGETRRDLVKKLRAGGARWLCNVGIATEGFNWPDASVVGMCVPTLSRPAYAQRAGRGTRPLSGLLNGLSSSSSRRGAIAASNKPSMLILDFVGVSANLDLVSHDTFLDEPATALAPEEEESFVNEDEETFEEPEEDGAFEPGNLNLRALARGVKSTTVHSYDEFNPFEASGAAGDALALKGSEIGKEPPLSHKQYRLLCRHGIDNETLTKTEAQKLVGFIAQHGFRLWAAQLGVLQKLYADVLRAREESFV
jgi:superfamily II DNA or RNA helicase